MIRHIVNKFDSLSCYSLRGIGVHTCREADLESEMASSACYFFFWLAQSFNTLLTYKYTTYFHYLQIFSNLFPKTNSLR